MVTRPLKVWGLDAVWPWLTVWSSAFKESPSLFDTWTLNKLFLRGNIEKTGKCGKQTKIRLY